MSTAISVLGGIGLFLLGMTVMTNGLKAVAGSALRATLGKAAATPLHVWLGRGGVGSWNPRKTHPGDGRQFGA